MKPSEPVLLKFFTIVLTTFTLNTLVQAAEYDGVIEPYMVMKLGSGVYYYTITAGQFSETKKMLLMK